MSYSTFINSKIINPSSTIIKEKTDKVDSITLDVPLLTRLLEFSRESVKSDEDLHVILTNLINLKNRGTLTMNDYDNILKKSTNELESIKRLAGI